MFVHSLKYHRRVSNCYARQTFYTWWNSFSVEVYDAVMSLFSLVFFTISSFHRLVPRFFTGAARMCFIRAVVRFTLWPATSYRSVNLFSSLVFLFVFLAPRSVLLSVCFVVHVYYPPSPWQSSFLWSVSLNVFSLNAFVLYSLSLSLSLFLFLALKYPPLGLILFEST